MTIHGRLLAGLVAMVLAVPLPAPPTAAGSPPVAAQSPSEPATAARREAPEAERHALAEARRTGRRVEVDALRTETGQVFANPSGTMTLEEHASPVRARRGNGWVTIDTRLRFAPDGSVRPGATAVPLRLSGGGTGDLVAIGNETGEVRMGWTGPLPRPVLAGDTATYPEIHPGIDLRVRVTADGFSQLLVVKNRQAALSQALRTLRYPLAATGLTLRTTPDRTTIAADRHGRTVFSAGAPLMWDGTGARAAELGLRLTGNALVVTPDQAMLKDPAAQFPLFIDPSFSGAQYRWTHVNKKYPDQSYWSYDRADGAKVGLAWDGSGNLYRSLFQMPTSTIAGTVVKRTWFAITLDHSPSGTSTPVNLWHTKLIDPAVALTWNNSGSHWLSSLAQASGHAWTGGGEPDMGMEFASTALTNLVQNIADTRAGSITLGLGAPDEANRYQWKIFKPATAKIVVEYNTKPLAPTKVNFRNPLPCGTATAPTPINTTQPEFSAVATDPDGQGLTTTLEIVRSDGVLEYSMNSSTTSSGAAFSWPSPVPAGELVDGGRYSFRARTSDGQDLGPYSATCHFVVDTVRPQTPTVTSADYPDGEPMILAGTTGTVTFRPTSTDTDVAEYLYGFEQDKVTLRVKAATDGTATVPITVWPDASGIPQRQLFVHARDRAGNVSPVTPMWTLYALDNAAAPARVRGDASGDGRADVTAVLDHGFGRTAIWNIVAHSGGFHAGTMSWDAGTGGDFALSRSRAVRGDFDGDGRTDIAFFREEAGRRVTLRVATSDGNRYDMLGTTAWDSLTGTWPLSTARMLSGDVNGDGKTDIAVQRDLGSGNWEVLVFPGGNLGAPVSWLKTASGSGQWAKSAPQLADIDGDGKDDLVDMRDMGSCRMLSELYRSTGTAFTGTVVTLHDTNAGNWCWDRSTQVVGDVDGDGRDDIVALYDYRNGTTDAGLWAFRSTGTALAPESWWRQSGEFDPVKMTLSTGDFDADGKDDLAVVYACCSTGTRQLWTLRSTGTAFAPRVLQWEASVGAVTGPQIDIQPRSYELLARHSSQCLEVDSASTADRQRIQQWTCNGGLWQRFRIESVAGTEQVVLKPVHSLKCVTLDGSSLSDGAAVLQLPCASGAANQQLTLEYIEGSSYDTVLRLRFAHSGKCAVIASASQTGAADVVQQPCGSAGDQWVLRSPLNSPLGGRYKIRSEVSNGRVLDVRDCQTADGADVRIWDSISTSPCQKWQVTNLGDDVYRITDGNTGKALDVSGCSTANAAVVHLWSVNGADCQLWRIEPSAGSTYSVLALNSGKSLDVAGCSSAAGADVIIWPYHGGTCQRWIFEKV